MTVEKVKQFEKIQGQLQGFYSEVSTLSKKSPNDLLNKFKLKFINQLLALANEFLIDEYKPLQEFDLFEEDDLPSNSDVILILEQYLKALERFRADNVTTSPLSSGWFWKINGKASEIKTHRPHKLNLI